MPDIVLHNIEKKYGSNARNAVDKLNLTIEDGEFLCVLGPSGCGKTTTLRMIAGLEHPTHGVIRVGERVMDDVAGGILVPAEGRGMGLVFQNYALWPHMSVEKNIRFGLELRRLSKQEQKQQAERVMQTMAIEPYRDRYPSQLSGGQQQRVALARMLAVNPQVMLLDEPLSNLDSRLRLEMRAELKRIHDSFHSTIVFVTHDQWEAMTLATRIAVMLEGRLQQVGTPMEIYDRPANRFVAEFLGNPPINMIELGQEGGEGECATQSRNFLEKRGIKTAASLGIRPESLSIFTKGDKPPAQDWQLNAHIIAILPTGGSWIIETHCAGQPIFAVSSTPPLIQVGDDVTLAASFAVVHIFAADGGRMT